MGLLITFLILWFSTEPVPVQITDFSWNRSIAIEDFQPRARGDWQESVPFDAYNRSSSQKIRSYKQVPDGTEQVAVTKSRPVTKIRTVNTGNGGFTTETYTDYESYTDYETRTKYKDVPVYDTWIDYTVDRWGSTTPARSSGNDRKPYWPETNVSSHNPVKIGDTREGARSQSYQIHLLEQKDKDDDDKKAPRTWEETVEFSRWQSFDNNENLIIEVNKLGVITNLFTQSEWEAEQNK